MALTNYAAYKTRIAGPYQRVRTMKSSQTTVAGRFSSFWGIAPNAGSTPGAAAVPTNATTGALAQKDSTGVMRLAETLAQMGSSGYVMICDRLLHQGGSSGIVTTAQTVGGAITRNTGGVGNFLAAEVYTQVGATATTITASYTNQAGTASQTTQAVAFGGTGAREVQRFIPLPLAQGDSGVRACASATVLATTGTAGSFGITIWRPLFAMPIPAFNSQSFLYDSVQLVMNMPVIDSGACLWFVAMAFTTTSGVMMAAPTFIEE